MVTQQLTEKTFSEFRGMSTDEKPVAGVSNGSVFVEMDTSSVFMFDAETETWKKV